MEEIKKQASNIDEEGNVLYLDHHDNHAKQRRRTKRELYLFVRNDIFHEVNFFAVDLYGVDSAKVVGALNQAVYNLE